MERLKFTLFLSLILMTLSLPAQITIESCQEKAYKNYPLIKQFGLIDQTRNFNLENAAKAYLPQVGLSARATFQSEVTEIPIHLPNLTIEGLTRDQYQVVAEINQTIWDGGVIQSQNKITRASAEAEKQRLEVELYTLKDRVNQLFFGILLISEQLKQNELLLKELQVNFDRIGSYMKNGIANQADQDALQVEILKARQQRSALQTAGRSYREMLSALMKETISGETVLVKPENRLPGETSISYRPELLYFDAQQKMLESQQSVLYAANRPKIGAFLQGGIGKPGLNMLKNEFSPFYIGGIRLSWNFGGLYTLRNNLGKINMSQQTVEVQKETFLFNNSLLSRQQNNEINRIRDLIVNDDEIIRLRSNIKHSAEAKVSNGTLSVSELIREINAENMAVQDKALHEIQLLLSVYNLKNLSNQ
jgi:outer membrane protein TolC